MLNILITGSTGFIGKALVEKLSTGNYTIYAISRNENAHFPECVKLLVGDITDKIFLKSLTSLDIHTLIDLAALTPKSTDVQKEDFSQIIESNIQGHLELVSVLSELKKIIFASTIDIYGTHTENEFEENDVPNPCTYYAASKLSLEYFYKVFSLKNNIKLTILRFSQVYGKGDTYQKFIPRLMETIKTGTGLVLYNKGVDKRRYLHIDDAVEACVLSLGENTEGVYNVAGVEVVTIQEVIAQIEKIKNQTIDIVHKDSDKKGDLVMSIKKAEEILHFNPKVSLTQGLENL